MDLKTFSHFVTKLIRTKKTNSGRHQFLFTTWLYLLLFMLSFYGQRDRNQTPIVIPVTILQSVWAGQAAGEETRRPTGPGTPRDKGIRGPLIGNSAKLCRSRTRPPTKKTPSISMLMNRGRPLEGEVKHTSLASWLGWLHLDCHCNTRIGKSGCHSRGRCL